MVEVSKLLITGGSGFIGSNFIRYMLETYPKGLAGYIRKRAVS